MAYVLVKDFRDDLSREIERLEGGILLAADMTGVSDRGLRRILSGKQRYVSDRIFDKIATAFDWDHWAYTVHGTKEFADGEEESRS